MENNRDHGDETSADAYDESEPQGVSGAAAGCDIYGYPAHDWRDDKIAQQAVTIADQDAEIEALVWHSKRVVEEKGVLLARIDELNAQIAMAEKISLAREVLKQEAPVLEALSEDERKQRDYAAVRAQFIPERY